MMVWTDRKLSDGFASITTVFNSTMGTKVVASICDNCKLSHSIGKITVDGLLELCLGARRAQCCVSRRAMLRGFLQGQHRAVARQSGLHDWFVTGTALQRL
jgi:hypothetical protein